MQCNYRPKQRKARSILAIVSLMRIRGHLSNSASKALQRSLSRSPGLVVRITIRSRMSRVTHACNRAIIIVIASYHRFSYDTLIERYNLLLRAATRSGHNYEFTVGWSRDNNFYGSVL
jgi:hypothetical protein